MSANNGSRSGAYISRLSNSFTELLQPSRVGPLYLVEDAPIVGGEAVRV